MKKTTLEAYSRPRTNGINAIIIREDDHLLEATLTNGNSEIMLALHSGKCVRFNEQNVRAVGRSASGVRGITLADDNDYVVGMVCMDEDGGNVLVVSEKGFGKRSLIDDYRVTNRGGKGVKTLNITDKTGGLVALKKVTDEDDLMIINRSGLAIRLHVNQLRILGRATQGVKLININEKDQIAAVARVPYQEDEPEEVELTEGAVPAEPTEEPVNETETTVDQE